jgi:hexosaminidase
LKPYVPGTKIYYTLDGSDPTMQSALYKEAIRVNLKTKPVVKLNVIQVTPSGNTSLVYSADYMKEK